jgi:hypothetical protein
LNYCPHCGADLSVATGDRLYERWFRPALVVVGAATLSVGSLALLLALLIVTIDLPEGDCVKGTYCTVTFQNKTDTTLCYSAVGRQSGCDEIKPRGKTEFALHSCQGEPEITVHTRSGSEVYRRAALCNEWDTSFILINQRDGEFVIVDSIPPRTETPAAAVTKRSGSPSGWPAPKRLIQLSVTAPA